MDKTHDILANFIAEGSTFRGSFYIDRTSLDRPMIRLVDGTPIEEYDVFEVYQNTKNSKDKPYYQFLNLTETSEQEIVSFYNQWGAIGSFCLWSEKEFKRRMQLIKKKAKGKGDHEIAYLLIDPIDTVKAEASLMEIAVNILAYLNEGRIKEVRDFLLENAEMLEPSIKIAPMDRLLRDFIPEKQPILEDFQDAIKYCNQDDLIKFTEAILSILFRRVLWNVMVDVKIIDKKPVGVWKYRALLEALWMQLWLDIQSGELQTRHCAYCGKLFPLTRRQIKLEKQGKRLYCPDSRCAKNAAQAAYQEFKTFIKSKNLNPKKLSQNKRKELKAEFKKKKG